MCLGSKKPPPGREGVSALMKLHSGGRTAPETTQLYQRWAGLVISGLGPAFPVPVSMFSAAVQGPSGATCFFNGGATRTGDGLPAPGAPASMSLTKAPLRAVDLLWPVGPEVCCADRTHLLASRSPDLVAALHPAGLPGVPLVILVLRATLRTRSCGPPGPIVELLQTQHCGAHLVLLLCGLCLATDRAQLELLLGWHWRLRCG